MEGAGEVATKIYSGGTPKTGITEYWDNGTIPWMSSGEVNLETDFKGFFGVVWVWDGDFEFFKILHG
jgi:hypothetical protein